MANTGDISAKSTHDLWVEARQFKLEIARPTPTTIQLTVTRPLNLDVTDGAVILLHDKPISGANYPNDGTQYTASTDFAVPADRIEGPSGAHVVAFYSEILGIPFPTGTVNASAKTETFTITITNTIAAQLYYASVHAATNILQYYPIGVQSYPLEGSRIEKDSSTYSGNIPSLPETPTDPTPNMVYHDERYGIAQYWTGTQWIPVRSDSIPTGPVNPGIAGQVYFRHGQVLRVFDGVKWVTADSSNFQIRDDTATFVPMNKVRGVLKEPDSPDTGDIIWNFTTRRASYWNGSTWIYPDSSNTLFNAGTMTSPNYILAFVEPATFETADLPDPTLGLLFYNTTTQALNVWTGSQWVQANTDQAGTPLTDKVAIGTDGSYDERVRLIKVLQGQLGWPQSCVELQEEQFNIAIDNALDNYRMWSDGAYRLAYVMFQLNRDQQLYYLNNAIDKTDRIVNVQKVHRLNVLGIEHGGGHDAIWTSGILTSYYSASTVDILSLHLLSNLSEEFTRIFAGDMTFLWDEASRELFLTRKVFRQEKVILEVQLERTEQEILVDRWAKQFIQNWALAEAKMQLGMIRSRYSSGTPGAAGTINQNGELLISEARQDMTELKDELLAYEYGGHIGQGNVSFLIG